MTSLQESTNILTHSTKRILIYLKVVSKCFMAEMMNKKKTIRVHPPGYLLQKFLVVLHMLFQRQSQFLKRTHKVHAIQKGFETAYLKHFYGKYSVIGCFHIKRANICNNDLHILELKIPIEKERGNSWGPLIYQCFFARDRKFPYKMVPLKIKAKRCTKTTCTASGKVERNHMSEY